MLFKWKRFWGEILLGTIWGWHEDNVWMAQEVWSLMRFHGDNVCCPQVICGSSACHSHHGSIAHHPNIIPRWSACCSFHLHIICTLFMSFLGHLHIISIILGCPHIILHCPWVICRSPVSSPGCLQASWVVPMSSPIVEMTWRMTYHHIYWIYSLKAFKWIANYLSDVKKSNSWAMEEVHKKGTWHNEAQT